MGEEDGKKVEELEGVIQRIAANLGEQIMTPDCTMCGRKGVVMVVPQAIYKDGAWYNLPPMLALCPNTACGFLPRKAGP
jgi:hypothetical protein